MTKIQEINGNGITDWLLYDDDENAKDEHADDFRDADVDSDDEDDAEEND